MESVKKVRTSVSLSLDRFCGRVPPPPPTPFLFLDSSRWQALLALNQLDSFVHPLISQILLDFNELNHPVLHR